MRGGFFVASSPHTFSCKFITLHARAWWSRAQHSSKARDRVKSHKMPNVMRSLLNSHDFFWVTHRKIFLKLNEKKRRNNFALFDLLQKKTVHYSLTLFWRASLAFYLHLPSTAEHDQRLCLCCVLIEHVKRGVVIPPANTTLGKYKLIDLIKIIMPYVCVCVSEIYWHD